MKARSKVLSACLVIIALCLPSFAGAGEIDLMPYAVSNLTEVLGYTAEEAEAFVFERREGGEVAFWHPDHPDWVYTVFIDRKTGQISGTTPFDTGYARYRGENTVRELAAGSSGIDRTDLSEDHESFLGTVRPDTGIPEQDCSRYRQS